MATLIVDADKIIENANTIGALCQRRGLALLPVAKSFGSCAPVVNALRQAGFRRLGLACPAADDQSGSTRSGSVMIALPAPERAEKTVRAFGASHNSEPTTIRRLDEAAGAAGLTHDVVVMVEVGDLREGVLPEDVLDLADEILALERPGRGVRLRGLAANFGCLSGLLPCERSFELIEDVAKRVRRQAGGRDLVVSIGGSVALPWVEAGVLPPSANELRVGYSMVLGRIPAAFGDEARPNLAEGAVILKGTILEVKEKPSLPWGDCGRDAFGNVKRFVDLGVRRRAVLDFGLHDTTPDGLTCLLPGVALVGANSNCSVYDVSECPEDLRPGDALQFVVHSYGALARGFHSQSLTKIALPARIPSEAPARGRGALQGCEP